jgi:hypothetical protein
LTAQKVKGGINYKFTDLKQQKSEELWTDYHRTRSPETEIFYVVSDGQIIQSPNTIVGHVESERNILVYLFHVLLTTTIKR